MAVTVRDALPSAQSNVMTPTFTFQQIERMASAMARSGLFGAKNDDEALVVLMIAQAEGIHPMTAATTYHIMDIQGRKQVTMKSNIMVARFQAAGGKLTWNQLDSTAADATFEHPLCPKPVRIRWDEKRATDAGLWGKDMWKKYRQAMLRSRVESEGVRSALPMVIMGKYTPEEVVDMDAEPAVSVTQAINMADRPGLLQSLVDEWLQQIQESATIDDLRAVYKGAMAEARKAKDEMRIGTFTLAYDAQFDLISEAAAKAKGESQQEQAQS